MEHLEQYDRVRAAFYDRHFTGLEGDVEFYLEEALRAKGSVLELGCGTGRMLIPFAQAGIRVTGLDRSAAMLDIARAQLDQLDAPTRHRIRLVEGDMRDFTLGRRFKLVLMPYRTFMHLMTPEDQVYALMCIRNHMAASGRLAFDIFAPELEMASRSPSPALTYDTEFVHPETGRRVVAWYSRRYNLVDQLLHQEMVLDELGEDGAVVQRTYSPLTLRYTHRYEMHYLLELCGFEVEALFGDFNRNPYAGGGQVWIARLRR
jgi:SAM-dependent methyltransferase